MLESATTKAAWRLIPLLGICFFVAIFDRTNVGVASLEMNADIGLSNAAYGFGAGVFFIAYFLFELPSNLALNRYGARRWIARIMISWGVVSILMAFMFNDISFYVMRFLLGAAEAGFFPGVVFYFYQWFDSRSLAKMMGIFFAFGPAASVIGSPLAAWIVETFSWHWVFVVGGVPAILLALVVLRVLPDRIDDADWLTTEEKRALAEALPDSRATEHAPWTAALKDRQTILMCLQYLLIMTSSYALTLWLPQVISALGNDTMATGWLTAIPFAAAAVGMIIWANHSTRTGERVWHTVLPCLLAGSMFALGAFVSSPGLALLMLSLAAVGVYAAPSAFWALPRTFVSGSVAAAGTALANSFGNLGGFIGPYLNGWLRDLTGGFEVGMALLGIPITLGGLLTFAVVRLTTSTPAPSKERV
jgi:MFS transporter, ACS family, tartrate transporter